jgi:hypothetical protein
MPNIERLINALKNIEVDARKAKDLAQSISESTQNPSQVALDMLETATRNTVVGIYHALREAEAIKAKADKEESK